MSDRSSAIWKMQKNTMTMFAAEIVGTGILIFLGCMGNIGTMGPAPPPPLQTALTFGLTVNLIIMMLGHVSGAHLNPAVTIGAIIVGLKSIPTGAIYIIGQFIGATVGYGILKMITPAELFNDGNLNSTAGLCVTIVHPEINSVQAILIEVFCTSCILCAACATWDPRCAHTTDSTALRFGLSVAAISFAASPYTGCSMNPARTFGPAFWNNAWKDQWIYWLGPIMGALLGTYAYQILFAEKQSNPRKSICLTDEKLLNILPQSNKACNITQVCEHQVTRFINLHLATHSAPGTWSQIRSITGRFTDVSRAYNRIAFTPAYIANSKLLCLVKVLQHCYAGKCHR